MFFKKVIKRQKGTFEERLKTHTVLDTKARLGWNLTFLKHEGLFWDEGQSPIVTPNCYINTMF